MIALFKKNLLITDQIVKSQFFEKKEKKTDKQTNKQKQQRKYTKYTIIQTKKPNPPPPPPTPNKKKSIAKEHTDEISYIKNRQHNV